MPGWIFYVAPTGFILGGLSGWALFIRKDENRTIIGVVCALISATLGYFQFYGIRSESLMYSINWGLAEFGSGAVWAVLLFGRSIDLVAQGVLQRREQMQQTEKGD